MQIIDISPRDDNTTRRLSRNFQSVSGKALCCALHPAGQRAYLGGHSGVWRSDDGGATWRHLEWPQPPDTGVTVPGALLGTTIYDIVVSHADPDVVVVAVGKDARMPSAVGLWRTADGGATWTRVHQFTQGTAVTQANCLSMAADDADFLFAAGGSSLARSIDGGLTWTTIRPQAPFQNVWYVAVAPAQGAVRHVYAAGSRIWHSTDGGTTWQADAQTLSLGAQGDGSGPGARSLSVHPASPNVVFVATFESNAAINNVEGIVWRGTFTGTEAGEWLRLPPIPLNYPNVTASGSGWVVPVLDVKTRRLVLVASDRRTVHLAEGEPADPSGWTRIEDANCHLDPHGFSVSAAYSRVRSGGGRALLVNDGGPNISSDGARRWTNGLGVSSLGIVNAAIAPQTNKGAAICMGMGDNFGFASPDDGATWETQHYLGGDNDCAFSDPRQPRRLVVFAPRDGKGDGGVGRGVVYLYATSADRAPDTSFGTGEVQRVPGAPPLPSKIIDALNDPDDPAGALARLNAAWNVVSFFYNMGYRPLVLTTADEPVPDDVDFVTVRFTDGLPELVRTTKLSLIDDAQFWETNNISDGPDVRAFKVGPPLPSTAISVVQASGGHASTSFFVGEQDASRGGQRRVWRWAPGMADWQPIVPGPQVPAAGRPRLAQRFFVDPYRPSLAYVLADDHVYRSTNGGRSWRIDSALERALTENGAFPMVIPDDGNPSPALLRDMQFDPHRAGHRYAVGPAGVFQTLDGARWTCLLRASASACRPMNLAYDFASCPRALYVSTSNRGILKLAPLPPEWDFPIGSLQAAVGRVTLLRVHDVGTGFGPPGDQLDGEVVVFLDSQPEKAFGFKLRNGADRPVAHGMLDLLRDAFNTGHRVRLEFTRTGCRSGHIVRVIQQ